MPNLNKLSATEIARGIAAKKFTAEAVVRDCLDRIAEREPTIHAWASIDPDYALMQARALDMSPSSRGPLHGVPIGVKDIINTEHLSDRDGIADLQGPPLARRRRLRRARAHGRRGDPRQDRHCRVRRHVPGADRQSAQSRAHAGRLVVGLGGIGRRFPRAARLWHADRRLGVAAGVVLRLCRLQADVQPDQPPGHLLCGRDARHHRLHCAYGRRRGVHHRRAGQQAAGVYAARLPAAARPLPHAAVGHCRRADPTGGRGCRQAARGGGRIGQGDRPAGRIREALLHGARNHQQLRALQEHGRRLAAQRRQDQQGPGRPCPQGLRDEARGLHRGAATRRPLPRAHRRFLCRASTPSSHLASTASRPRA